jgi:uncharacterized protein YeaO (DUF488 family)
MIKIKHFLDTVEADDGRRLWIEPIKLTRDLVEMCEVAHVLTHLGPPLSLWEWFEEHPDGYDYFRAKYHENLCAAGLRPVLQRLACAAGRENYTLLHQGDDPQHNTATALYEMLSELSAYCPPDGP